MIKDLHMHLGLLRAVWAVCVLGLLSACASAPVNQPTPLSAAPAAQAASWVWNVPMSESSGILRMHVVGQSVLAASDDGQVVSIDGPTGRIMWRFQSAEGLSAGVGSDGTRAAVVTQNNELLSLEVGQVRWRVRLPARVLTPPLVAGGRVFVLLTDRSIMAFDGATGARLWTQTRASDPLVLRQAGALLAVGDTLIAGGVGRLQGFNPTTGRVLWDAALATPRGTNEIERLVDVVGPVSRVGNSVCARAFNSTVGCVDALDGRLVWTRPSAGVVGLHGDAKSVVGADSDGRLFAWQRSSGDVLWSIDRFKYRGLSAPWVVNDRVVIGDQLGVVHWLDLKTAQDQARWRTDGSAIVGAPVSVAGLVLFQTRKGGVYAWRAP